MPNLVNELTIQEYAAAFEGAEGIVVCSFNGLTVKESEELRATLEERGVGLRLVRNKLARRVLAERGFEFPKAALQGSTAIAWGSAEGAIHAAKVLTEPAIKKTGKVELRAGVLEGKVLGAADAVALASVPDRNTLNAQVLGALQGPARGLVGMLQAPLGALVRVLQARVDQQQPAAAAAEA